METICQHCGDKGFENAFVYCVNCLNFAVHRYCLPKIPATFDEFVRWFCEDCKPESLKQIRLRKPCFNVSLEKDHAKSKSARVNHARTELTNKDVLQAVPRIKLKEKTGVTCVEAQIEDQRKGASCSKKHLKTWKRIDLTERAQLAGACSDSQIILRRKKADVTSSAAELVGDKRQTSSSSEHDEAEARKDPASNVGNSLLNESNYCVYAQPVIDPIWRGSFSISNKDCALSEGVVAHLSSKACPKAYEEAGLLPALLCLEMLPKAAVWPKSFQISEPTDKHIALYFFPRNQRYEKVFDGLVDEMMDQELAMRAMVRNAELLVFTSNELPLSYWKFLGKFYLWGVFRGKQASFKNPDPANLDPVVQNTGTECPGLSDSANDMDTAECRSLTKTKTWDSRSPLSPLSNSISSGYGS